MNRVTISQFTVNDMISESSNVTVQRARLLYESQLRQQLERDFRDQFVCIEPVSGRYFIGKSFDDAVNAALDACPDQLTYTMRVGHSAALQLGVLTQ